MGGFEVGDGGVRWKSVDWYEGLPGHVYSISDHGDVRSNNTGKLRTLAKSRTGYRQIALQHYDFHYAPFAHKLVAIAFVPNPENHKEINHKDGVKHNNHYSNLEWCTRGQNIKHAYDNALRSAKGSMNARAVLNEREVAFIRGLRELGLCRSQIMEGMGISGSVWQSVLKNWPDIEPMKFLNRSGK